MGESPGFVPLAIPHSFSLRAPGALLPGRFGEIWRGPRNRHSRSLPKSWPSRVSA